MIVYEYRTTTRRKGKPVLLEEDVPSMSGGLFHTFRSVYGYPEETADFIKKNGNTRGLKNKEIYSDVLLIDADTHDEYVATLEKLVNLEIGFQTYHTGNRGGHIHIPIVPMQGTKVIYSQKKWMKDVGIWELVDTSIYREGGQYRLIGATHRKTGLQKELIQEYTGELLEIPLVTPPPVAQEPVVVKEGTPEARMEYAVNLMTPKTEGSRHMHFYILYKRGLEAGFTPEEIFDDIRWYNETLCDPPHAISDLEKKFGGFR